MSPKVTAEFARLPDFTVNQLVERYTQVFGEECRSRNKQYLVRRIAWRLQANDEGGLSQAAIAQAKKLAGDADVRVTAPRKQKLANVSVVPREPSGFFDWDPRLPPPSNIVERQYKGRMIRVVVLNEGFEYEDERYRSLSAVAKTDESVRSLSQCAKRLGKEDRIVRWKKPTSIRSVDWPTYHTFPDSIVVREARIRVKQPGFRTRSIVVVTTLLDPAQYPKEELALLYRARWHNELDLRSIKSVMQMDCLRCKTPELVRKEIWTHVLAYNLIRTIMAQAASRYELLPRTISFKGTLQTLEAFQPMLAIRGESNRHCRERLYEQLLAAIITHRVGDRPDRIEPRRIKRRHKHYVPLSVPRAEAKRQIMKRLSKN